MRKIIELCSAPGIMTNIAFALCSGLYQHYLAAGFVDASVNTIMRMERIMPWVFCCCCC